MKGGTSMNPVQFLLLDNSNTGNNQNNICFASSFRRSGMLPLHSPGKGNNYFSCFFVLPGYIKKILI